ncbi:DNA/RNA helicase domain-containing protein, partial [Bacillus sp. JJ722]|uniref:DNA/RNA helicase domain-containing protein n=1 Tax=Bacillus sp. JJ722 TaxID=3122973 RepID=UPI002FFF8318
IEKQLITLFVTDNEKGKKRLEIDNKTRGNSSNNEEDRKEIDAHVISSFWENDLRNLGCVNKDVSYLKKRILAKYSPFMDLSSEQEKIVEQIITSPKNYIIEGGSGTGKTVLMTNAVARIFDTFEGNKKIGVVVKANWRKNARRIFEDYGINKNITVGTWGTLVSSGEKYDYIIVDEAHRLPRYYGKLHPSERKYFNGDTTKNSLELLDRVTDSLILLYDRYQSIRPSDIPTYDFDEYVKNNKFKKIPLAVQFRIDIHDTDKNYTADDYIKGIKYILQISDDNTFDKSLFNNPDPDSYFGFVDSIKELFEYINRMDNLI